ncbi:chromate transporter [Aquincola sp. MAHUQ-54]|uniref:Chromate transporter n=1 Tax=Aquincola agrisoli TaxID=3119538 RepID=A0AAW9QMK0_9BURK
MTWLVGPHALGAAEWLGLFGHFLMLSMLAIGGAIATAPEIHRYVVGQHGWLTDAQFTASVALAQAAPGPNVLFLPVIGYGVGGLAGAAVVLVGSLIPSTTLALLATRWGAQRRSSRGVRAFVAGMAPITLGLLLSTGWILTEPSRQHAGSVALVLVTVAVMWRTKTSPIWMVGLGAVAGMLGWA